MVRGPSLWTIAVVQPALPLCEPDGWLKPETQGASWPFVGTRMSSPATNQSCHARGFKTLQEPQPPGDLTLDPI